MIWILIVILGVGLDQWTKYWAVSELAVRGDMAVIDPLIYFRYHVNTGAAWSFLADKSWGIYVLVAFSGASIAFLLILLKLRYQLRFCLSLVLAGSIGNLIDRVWRGGVVDFISFQFGDYFFPIFNVADTLLVIGLILGLIFIIFTDSRHAFEEI